MTTFDRLLAEQGQISRHMRGIAANMSRALLVFAESLLNPFTLIPFFIALHTISYQTIALAPAVWAIGWMLPQFVTPWFQRATRRQLPWAAGALIVRAIALVALAYSVSRSGASDDSIIRSFYLWYTIAMLAGGFAYLPVRAVTGQPLSGGGSVSISSGWYAGTAGLAIVGGLATWQSLGPDGPSTSRVLSMLATLSALATAAAIVFLFRIREEADGSSGLEFASTGTWLSPFGRNPFVRWLIAGALLALTFLAEPFYIVHAQRDLGAPRDFAGIAVLLVTASIFLSIPFWRWLAKTSGYRLHLQLVALLHGGMAMWAFTIPRVLTTSVYTDNFSDPRVPHHLFNLVFILSGLAAGAAIVGSRGYLDAISPPGDRFAYWIDSLLLLIPLGLASFIGAALIDRTGYDRLFLGAGVAALAAVVGTALLDSTNTAHRSSRDEWQLRSARR